jgi:hypothetical protein
VTVTSVAPNQSSVKITYQPVPGAKDYRVYDVANPGMVKYAGLVHLPADPSCPGPYCQHHFAVQADGVTPVYPYHVLSGPSGGPQALDTPATQIEWNAIGDGQRHTLVVDAVDALGPVPYGNLYSGADNMPVGPSMMGMLGSNEGPTTDGKTSINGQGPYTDNPQVIATSQQFVVQANSGQQPIPSGSDASSTFFDPFNNAEGSTLTQVARNDDYDSAGNLGSMQYSLNANTSRAWQIEYRQSDNSNSQPMIENDHFMDVLFDGATPGNVHGAPTHTIYGSMSMSPTLTADMSNGKVLHITMEVDGHMSSRRWVGIDLAPASDPLQAWNPESGARVNSTDQALFLGLKSNFCTLDIFTGSTSSTNGAPTGTAGGSGYGARLWGEAGSSGGAPNMCTGDQLYDPSAFSENGPAFDNRSRYDVFLSESRAALFINGRLVVQSAIPPGSFPWANGPVKVYFSHYLYHSDADMVDVTNYLCYPQNAYWFNDPMSGTTASQTQCNQAYPGGFGFQHSDERHWDNMGFESLPQSSAPSGGDFSGFAARVQPPAPQAPTFSSDTGSTPTATSSSPTPRPTNTPAIPTNTPAIPTNTPAIPTNTPVPPTRTPTNTATSTPTSTATKTPIPTSTPVKRATVTSGTTQLGLTSVGAIQDSGCANDLSAARVTTGSQTEIVKSISAYVGMVNAAPANQYSLAIYTDINGKPGSLVARSANGTLVANSWNTLQVLASLRANTMYWLVYNTNGSVNNLYYNTGASNSGSYSNGSVSFGTWPTAFSAPVLGPWQYSLYASVSP